MKTTILDCYTDEPSGLGVPPNLGTYPRYLYGILNKEGIEPTYITIDDLRSHIFYHDKIRETTPKDKTNIRVYNRTRDTIGKILKETEHLIVILGVHVPGKYLSALPGTLKEVVEMIKDLPCKKTLTGPALFGTQLEGGKYFEQIDVKQYFNQIRLYGLTFAQLKDVAPLGAGIIKQIPDPRIIEIETGRGCAVGKCSFCTEPLKSETVVRETDEIIEEMKAYYNLGCRYFRIGKQSDFYAIQDPIGLLQKIWIACPDIEILHIDNVNPINVVRPSGIEITKAIVKYCTPGNIAAFGVETFDPLVVRANTLNCMPEVALRAVEIINTYGAERGSNGMPKYLPGINIIFGLYKETKDTHDLNMKALKTVMEKGWMLRRINIRQVAILPNTKMEELCGDKFLRKNKKYYWKWRNQIRQEIDFPMLDRIVPKGTILKNVRTEIYDGNTTFARQIGTYPLIVGIKGRLPLKQFYDVKITGHMLRSVTGEVVCNQE